MEHSHGQSSRAQTDEGVEFVAEAFWILLMWDGLSFQAGYVLSIRENLGAW